MTAAYARPVRTLTRPELTAALAARQLLLERRRMNPAEAIRRLTPLQAQHPPAPYLALAARLEGFTHDALEAAIGARVVVKTTIMRLTLHLAAAADYPSYAQLTRQSRLRNWRKRYGHLDEARLTAELTRWLSQPRTGDEIRERIERDAGVSAERWSAVAFARTLLPLVQLPPAGFRLDPRRPSFVVDPRPLPAPVDAAALVLSRYLAAFGPASRRDVGAWAGVAQRDFADAWPRLRTVSYRDEQGSELLDLPGRSLPPASTPLPPRLLAHWDQTLLAYADRERIMPRELQPLRLTHSGDPTVTVAGRVAASWKLERGRRVTRLRVTPHRDIDRSARAAIHAEAERMARFAEPAAGSVEVVGV